MRSDAVIIGAGVIGAQTALQLLDRGLTVTLVDPGPPGGEQAASYGNAAWLSSHSVIPPSSPGVWRQVPRWLRDPLGPLAVRPSYLPRALPWLWRYLRSASTPAKVEAIARALRTLLVDAPALHAEVAAKAGLAHLIDAKSGLMHVYTDRAGFEAEALGWRIRRDLGIVFEEIESEALAERQPDLSREYRFGVFVPEAGHCRNPGAYVAGLVAHAESRGARRIAARALDFRHSGGRLGAVVTTQGEIDCGTAIIAAGVRSGPLAAKAGDRVPLDSERGYHAIAEGDGPGPTTPIMVGDRKVVITRLEQGVRCAGQVEIGGIEALPDWRRAEILKSHLVAMFPGIDTSRIRFWMGHRPSTPDGIPCIGAASGVAGVVHAFGHGHIGLVSSARTGRLAAQLATGEAPEIDLTPFSAQRFS
ncbi:D-amino-acid dehydrogenase [Nitratireductor indicus C115]|uniref:D-amino-acid dehydrogenase n=1 Tax=Nitratireductor indicus C115 TaxID=1231190 RepID=K2P394_9HYPH|nr:FAD-binding oxidoreductase [Nitratireductor indicus]EKF41866.1 D-amino-acid dehydrogenase [Nitratireductor indicus C115]SFQ66496.1 D-amino-acid dehydrogenase [Nitratireductor indicus]